MLHANEAWRQLTGAELQRGVSTGLWESFEFLAVQPQASGILISPTGTPWMKASCQQPVCLVQAHSDALWAS